MTHAVDGGGGVLAPQEEREGCWGGKDHLTVLENLQRESKKQKNEGLPAYPLALCMNRKDLAGFGEYTENRLGLLG